VGGRKEVQCIHCMSIECPLLTGFGNMGKASGDKIEREKE
jgi:hypothetical protein